MREYKFYYIRNDGHVSGAAEVHECPDDRSAIQEVNLAAAGSDIEIWQGARMVAYVVADETKQTPPARKSAADQHK